MKERPEQTSPTPCEKDGEETTACPDHRPVLVTVVGVGLTYAVCRRCRGATLLSRTPEGALAAFEAGWVEHRPEMPAFEETDESGVIPWARDLQSGDEK